jgi:hypothetical protein
MTLEEFMKVLGLKIKDMEEDLNFFLMGTNIKVNILMEKLMEKEHIHGETMKYTMENGKMVKKMAMEYGKVFMEIVILDNGKIAKQKDMESIHGLMETDMKENGNNA